MILPIPEKNDDKDPDSVWTYSYSTGTTPRKTVKDHKQAVIRAAVHYARLKHFGMMEGSSGPISLDGKLLEREASDALSRLVKASTELLYARTLWEELNVEEYPTEAGL